MIKNTYYYSVENSLENSTCIVHARVVVLEQKASNIVLLSNEITLKSFFMLILRLSKKIYIDINLLPKFTAFKVIGRLSIYKALASDKMRVVFLHACNIDITYIN